MTIEPQPQLGIRLLRRRAGLSQDDFAFLVGVDASQVSRLEAGTRIPRLDEALMIQLVFGAAGAEVFSQVRRTAPEVAASRIQELQRRQQQGPGRMSAQLASYKADRLEAILASIRSQMSVQSADDRSV